MAFFPVLLEGLRQQRCFSHYYPASPSLTSCDGYVGRFAPSPTGLLHAGSLATALASWLAARAFGGRWLLRIEDIDFSRCRRDFGEKIVLQLERCGLVSDEPVVWQSDRLDFYRQAFDYLKQAGFVYACDCSRTDILKFNNDNNIITPRGKGIIYSGICRDKDLVNHSKKYAWRFNISKLNYLVNWKDDILGEQFENVLTDVGDFIILRADGAFSYQLAVVVDDALQGITSVVRGRDLLDNTARQILIQHALGFNSPRYFHIDLVLANNGEKLSKQNGAIPIDISSDDSVLKALFDAAGDIGVFDVCPRGYFDGIKKPRDFLNELAGLLV